MNPKKKPKKIKEPKEEKPPKPKEEKPPKPKEEKAPKPKIKPKPKKPKGKVIVEIQPVEKENELYPEKLRHLIYKIKNQNNFIDTGIRFAWKK